MWAIVLLILTAPPGASALERIGRMEAPALREVSGIVASRRYPGVFWVHNDSGNPPALHAIRRDGTLLRSFPVAAPNLDWEDLAVDDAGHLYVGDIGNNTGLLPLRTIYRIDEPDPSRDAPEPLPIGLASSYRFAPGERFDAEGFYLETGRAVLISKTRDGRRAGLYAVPLDPPAPAFRPALAERVGDLPEFTEPATGAARAPDGRRLAVCSSHVARIYETGPGGRWDLRATVRYAKADGIEAIAWDGDDLILASEGRTLYRIAASRWRAALGARD